MFQVDVPDAEVAAHDYIQQPNFVGAINRSLKQHLSALNCALMIILYVW